MGKSVRLSGLILLALVLLGGFVCESPAPKINATIVNPKVFAKDRFRLQTELLQNGKGVSASASDFQYQAKFGTIQGDIYCAPEGQGEEVITIEHIPSKTSTKLQFPVMAAPVLVLKVERTRLNCEEALPITAIVKIGEQNQDIPSDQFVYKANIGTFNNNNYRAPQKPGVDDIEVLYTPLHLRYTLQLQILSQAILVAKFPSVVPCRGTIQLSLYFKDRDRQEPVSLNDVEIKVDQGVWKDNLYVAPDHACQDHIHIVHKATGQQLDLEITVESWKLEFVLPKSTLNFEDTMKIETQIYKGDRPINAPVTDFRFTALHGKFSDNIYRAPSIEGEDTISVEHIASGCKNAKKVMINYSPYVYLETDRFSLPLPTGWKLEKSDITFSAQGQENGKFANCAITATVLPGFDFLDIATIRLFFQQQIDSQNKNVEESGEEEIQIAGVTGLKITFENYSRLTEKSWCVFLKKDGAAYIIAFRGNRNFFEEEKIPDYILSNFQFKKMVVDIKKDFKISVPAQVISQKSFEISVPGAWKVHNISGGFLTGITKANESIAAVSNVNENGRAIILFILAHRQQEVRNFDLSLFLVLLRQMIKDTSIIKEDEVKEIDLKHGKGKLLEIEGGEPAQRTFLLATKYETTAYGILLRGPVPLWNANPELATRIIDSFVPVQ